MAGARKSAGISARGIVAASFAVFALAASAERPGFVLEFHNAPLGEVVEGIARLTGYSYLFEPPLPGRVTVAVPDRVGPEEAAEILNVVLLMKGFVAVALDSGARKILRAERLADLAPWTEGALRARSHEIVTTLVRVRFGDAERIAQAIGPLVQEWGQAVVYRPTNSLILAGSEGRVRRLVGIVRALDSAEEQEIAILPLHHADAEAIEEEIESLLASEPESGMRSRAVVTRAEERRNALLVRGTPDEVEEVREYVRKLDVPAPEGADFYVLHLRHAEPERTADLLRGLKRGEAPAGSPPVEAGADALRGLDFSVVAYRPTSSLVIRSDAQTFDTLARLVAQLDLEPRAVSVEAIVVEITTDGLLDLGVATAAPILEPDEPSDPAGVVITNPIGPGALIPIRGEPPEEAEGLEPPLFRLEGEPIILPILGPDGEPALDEDGNPQVRVIPGWGLVIAADQVAAEARILQRPHLLIENGEESEIFAGQNVPLPVASDQGSEDPLTLRQTIERADVGISLKVGATIGSDGAIRLDLDLSDRRVTAYLGGSLGFVFRNRDFSGSFGAAEGQTIVIGGLEAPATDELQRAAPGLADIPVVGNLFKATRKTARRTHLLIALQVRSIQTRADQVLDSIRRRRAFARHLAGLSGLRAATDAPYALRVASYAVRGGAERALRTLEEFPWPVEIVEQDYGAGVQFDVYALGFRVLRQASSASLRLRELGWDPELVVVPRSIE